MLAEGGTRGRADEVSLATHPNLERELPAWPVLSLLWGLPVWWAIGLMPFSTVILAFPMTVLLIQRRRILIVPGILPWGAFVAWLIPCAVALGSVGRMLGFSIRLAQFVAILVILVYVVNARTSLTPRRLLNGLMAVWVAVVGGGYLGLIWPEGRLSFTVGQLLPAAIVDNEYVGDLVFPAFAEIQDPWGAEEPFIRPSAPFAYTNGWGATMAMLTPVAIAVAIFYGRRARVWVVIGLLAGAVPAIASTNRGFFLTLAISVAYVVIRLLARGHIRAFLWATAGALAASLALIQAGFLELINARQDVADTSQGRGDLYQETLDRTLRSPVLGYGAPRPSATSEITVGTQGMIWNAMFCFGFVGLLLFATFLVGVAIRTWKAPSTGLLWLHSSLVATCAMSVYYGLDRQMLFFVVIAGLMLRERYRSDSDFWIPETMKAR